MNDEAQQEIIIFETGELKLDVRLKGKTVWLNLNQLTEMFNTTKSNISEHLKDIFNEEDIDIDSAVRFFRTTASDGKKLMNWNLKKFIC